MRKKAQVEIQFNWIYVAIVGVIILAIFVAIANGIRVSSRTKLEADALTYFDEIFVSMQGSENTEHSITLPGLDLEVETSADNCNFYTIEKSKLEGRSTEYVPLFSPDIIKKNILSYSLRWDVPFTANYFLYITSPDIAYVFIGGPELNELRDNLPNHLTAFPEEQSNAFSAGSFVNKNYYKVKFISFNQNPESFALDNSVKRLKDDQVTAIDVNPGQNSIRFYKKQRDSLRLEGTTYYVDMPTLIAAVYSENMGTYECNMDKALKRLDKITFLLNERSTLLMHYMSDQN